MAKITDVALKARVSVSTVSHVINRTRHVKPETVERVEKAIAELRYRPNTLARGLRRGESHTIGLLLPDNSNPFFAELARVVENIGFGAGYTVVLCNSDGSTSKEDTYLGVLLSKQIDGLIFAASSDRSEGLHRVLGAGLPVVIVDREIRGVSVDTVMVDNWQGGFMAGQFLAGLGHRRIGAIIGPGEIPASRARLEGFRQALKACGIRLPAKSIVKGDFHFASGVEAMKTLLARMPHLTALFASNDLMAMGAIAALRADQRRVPEDVSVLGFDNIPYTVTSWPPITTVAQPIEAIGRLVVETLLKRIKLPDSPPRRAVLQPFLVERESCSLVKI